MHKGGQLGFRLQANLLNFVYKQVIKEGGFHGF
jgi:hypothetical protein